ncbi:MAG: 2-oxoacid:acceptor oxidoreductase subunit alpha [Candidatus Dojkabacteria bacterium]
MNSRYVIKVAGAAGQGVKTSGLVLSKALKRAGFCNFGYTEYPSLIRGGHNVFQIEISDKAINSITKTVDVLLVLNEESIGLHREELADGGIIVFDDGAFSINEEHAKHFQEKKIQVIPVELLKLAKESGGTALMKNTVSLGAIWKIFGLEITILQDTVAGIFNKTEDMIKINRDAVRAGYDSLGDTDSYFEKTFTPKDEFNNHLIISGNESTALGAIAAGVRLYSSYPMTPASAILTYLAKEGTKLGMVVKQAEDEITAANMVVGASFNGTRAMCGTSGGGFDLMQETFSLAGMTETPFVVVVGQRPGPGTGVPTWTAQGDLDVVVNAGHGEFPRIVLAPGDSTESFKLTLEAHNLAEKYQTPVVFLTDKYLAESFFCTPSFVLSDNKVDRGKLVTGADLSSMAKEERYKLTNDGVSQRWVPGDNANTFVGNSDEHTPKGYSTEIADEIQPMFEKRMRKYSTILSELPDPEVFGDQENPSICIISWGSNKGVILDAMAELEDGNTPDNRMVFVHYSYVWPIKPDTALEMMKKASHTLAIENNYGGQFAGLFQKVTGVQITDRLTKYDSRPFYLEDIVDYLTDIMSKK